MEIKEIIQQQIKEIETETIEYEQEEANENISNILAKIKMKGGVK